jgi:hypothetical protein
MRALDTSQDAASAQLAAYRRMMPEARLRAGLELTAMARRLLAAGIRKRHPEYDDDQVRLASIRLWLGPNLFRAAYPHELELDP